MGPGEASMNNHPDRVRSNTSSETNRTIDQQMEACIARYAHAGPEVIEKRIRELEREWDIERWLEMNASSLAFIGLGLGVTHNKRWLVLPAVVLPFLFQHAVQGWCPPLPILRRMGIRTREEIDLEKYALKALRGDFSIPLNSPASALESAGR